MCINMGNQQMLIKDRAVGSLVGSMIADALAMPTHWFYDLALLKKTFGTVTGFVGAPEQFPNSYMSTGDPDGTVDVVYMFGKKKYWAKSQSYHYHYGLKAGQNTLDAHLIRLLVKHIVANKGQYEAKAFREQYVKFMVTPGTFNDKFASSNHRTFFKNYMAKEPLEECIGEDEHDEMDALFSAIPTVLLSLHSSTDQAKTIIKEAIMTTKFSERGVKFALRLREIFLALEKGVALKQVIANEAKGLKVKINEKDDDPVVACQIDKNWASMLHFLNKYPDGKQGLLANTNAGGENLARGIVMGAIYGFASGLPAFSGLQEGLIERETIINESTAFAQLLK